ncbi:hypothetical protein EDB85DRAFT_2044669, partial [Lactarius pseudohatsudake]
CVVVFTALVNLWSAAWSAVAVGVESDTAPAWLNPHRRLASCWCCWHAAGVAVAGGVAVVGSEVDLGLRWRRSCVLSHASRFP